MADRRRELKSYVTFSDGVSLGPDDDLSPDRAKELDQSAKDARLDVHPAFLDDNER
jgi:hypothetical protein